MEIRDFDVKIDQKKVLSLIDCSEESPAYEQVLEEYAALEKEVYGLIKARGVFSFSKDIVNRPGYLKEEDQGVVYVLMTVGKEVSQYSNQLFEKGDYLGGMLVDAMADIYLFSMEETMQRFIREACGAEHLGISRRLEAPGDIPMEVHKLAYEQVEAKEKLDIELSQGYMFSPVKTSCYLLVLTEDEALFEAQHDCTACSAMGCAMRKASTLTVINGDKVLVVDYKKNETILDVFKRHEIYQNAICGGRGSCGKCKVQIVAGTLEVTEADRKKLTPEEIEKGYRLSCIAMPKQGLTIRLPDSKEGAFRILTTYQGESKDLNESEGKDRTYAVAIDIGTTTLAIALVDEKTGEVLFTTSAINTQSIYGADVISRIQAANEGKGPYLRASVQAVIVKGIREILDHTGIVGKAIGQVVIGCNTTMGHILMGYSCESLGVSPFTPVNIESITESFESLFGEKDLACQVTILPGISTYVGGDIVAGLLACDFDETEGICLLVDFGTNGEMAIGNKDRILCTATAAGPAFEGGNISSGTGSVEGAICSITLEEKEVKIKTIGDKPPTGLCGTGVIEAVAELVKAELVDETGRLEEDYFEEGFKLATTEQGKNIYFTQKDLREVQLAKSAIRSGIEILIENYGITYEEIDKVYLAGGFGFNLDQAKAIVVGLFPEEIREKMKVIGNSCLGGAIKYIRDKEGPKRVAQIGDISTEINLSQDKRFNEYYVDYMYF